VSVCRPAAVTWRVAPCAPIGLGSSVSHGGLATDGGKIPKSRDRLSRAQTSHTTRRSLVRRALILASVLTCGARIAIAGGLDLSWEHCTADGGQIANRAFACL